MSEPTSTPRPATTWRADLRDFLKVIGESATLPAMANALIVFALILAGQKIGYLPGIAAFALYTVFALSYLATISGRNRRTLLALAERPAPALTVQLGSFGLADDEPAPDQTGAPT